MELLGDVGRGCKRLRAEGDGCVGGGVSECETVGAGEDGEGSARDMRRGREARGKWEVKGLREREVHGEMIVEEENRGRKNSAWRRR